MTEVEETVNVKMKVMRVEVEMCEFVYVRVYVCVVLEP